MDKKISFRAYIYHHQNILDILRELEHDYDVYFSSYENAITNKHFRELVQNISIILEDINKSGHISTLLRRRLTHAINLCISEIKRIRSMYFSGLTYNELYEGLPIQQADITKEPGKKALDQEVKIARQKAKLENFYALEKTLFKLAMVLNNSQVLNAEEGLNIAQISTYKYAKGSNIVLMADPQKIFAVFADNLWFCLKLNDFIADTTIPLSRRNRAQKNFQTMRLIQLTAEQEDCFAALDSYLLLSNLNTNTRMQNIMLALCSDQAKFPDSYFTENERLFKILQLITQEKQDIGLIYNFLKQYRPNIIKNIKTDPEAQLRFSLLVKDPKLAQEVLNHNKSRSCFRKTKTYIPAPEECVQLMQTFYYDKTCMLSLLKNKAFWSGPYYWKNFDLTHFTQLIELGLDKQKGKFINFALSRNKKLQQKIVSAIESFTQKDNLTAEEKQQLQTFLSHPQITALVNIQLFRELVPLKFADQQLFSLQQDQLCKRIIETKSEDLIPILNTYCPDSELLEKALTNKNCLSLLRENQQLRLHIEKKITILQKTTDFLSQKFILKNAPLWRALQLNFSFVSEMARASLATLSRTRFQHFSKETVEKILSNYDELHMIISESPQHKKLLENIIKRLFRDQIITKEFYEKNIDIWNSLNLNINKNIIEASSLWAILSSTQTGEYGLIAIKNILTNRSSLQTILTVFPESKIIIEEAIVHLFRKSDISGAFLYANDHIWHALGIDIDIRSLAGDITDYHPRIIGTIAAPAYTSHGDKPPVLAGAMT